MRGLGARPRRSPGQCAGGNDECFVHRRVRGGEARRARVRRDPGAGGSRFRLRHTRRRHQRRQAGAGARARRRRARHGVRLRRRAHAHHRAHRSEDALRDGDRRAARQRRELRADDGARESDRQEGHERELPRRSGRHADAARARARSRSRSSNRRMSSSTCTAATSTRTCARTATGCAAATRRSTRRASSSRSPSGSATSSSSISTSRKPDGRRNLSGYALSHGEGRIFVAEAGRVGVSSPEDVDALIDGCLNVMGALKMIDRVGEAGRAPALDRERRARPRRGAGDVLPDRVSRRLRHRRMRRSGTPPTTSAGRRAMCSPRRPGS